MSPAAWWILCALAHLGLVAATAFPPFTPGLGGPTWHHHASLALAAVFALVFAQRMARDRRFLGLGVAVTTALAVVSAFLLLYMKEDLKDWGLKDWAKWWHVAWSWFALAYFLGHTWVNRSGMLRSLRRVRRGVRGKLAFDGVLVVVAAAVPVTWSAWGAAEFTEPRYVPLTLYTWLMFLAPAYLFWAWMALRRRRGSLPRWAARPSLQAFVDGWLLPMTFLANVSGFPILYFGTKETTLKYVAKYWHTWPSIAMAILVFTHTMQFWPGMVAHWRRQGGRPSKMQDKVPPPGTGHGAPRKTRE